MDYRYGSHTVYQIEHHFVWDDEVSIKVLSGEVADGRDDQAVSGTSF
ncbi:hypothetical protein [Pseudomonas indica]|nr:hypothetical protein [Pseudomonas indica]